MYIQSGNPAHDGDVVKMYNSILPGSGRGSPVADHVSRQLFRRFRDMRLKQRGHFFSKRIMAKVARWFLSNHKSQSG
jgi:hypothetical protein